MQFPFKKRALPLVMVLALASILLPSSTRAQSYPIDCAILLCLSGGWPTSVPCSRARAEFIRRITPWPVEPPLQIWRCPMGASYELDRQPNETERFLDVLFEGVDVQPHQSFPVTSDAFGAASANAIWRSDQVRDDLAAADLALRYVRDRADIDISGPEFNFVRSIRVFDVRLARQYEAGGESDCERFAHVYLGSYGAQGDFSWTRSSPAVLPDAHVGLESWGLHCPSINHRSVFVEWRDYEGNYGFEQVNY